MPIYKSTAARNAACGAIVNLIDTGAPTPGYVNIYATGSTSLIASINFSGIPAFEGNPIDGMTQISGAIGNNAVSGGTAGWFSVNDSNGDVVWSGDCGTTPDSALVFTDQVIISGAYIQLDVVRFTVPE